MYVRVDENNQIVKFPYGSNRFVHDFKNVALGNNPSEETLAKFGVYKVSKAVVENYDRTKNMVKWRDVPDFENGKWVLKYDIVRLEDEKLEAHLAKISALARKNRNERLAQSDRLIFPYLEKGLAVPQQILDYRQALRDSTKQETFPHRITWPVLGDLT